MKSRVCLLTAVFALAGATVFAAAPREHLSLDRNWKFHLGDAWPDALRLDKAGAGRGPASADHFAATTWRTVNLPHDWAIELPFDPTADMNHGFKALGPGFEANSIGWYRRTFDLPATDAGRRLWLTFDGVYRDATVWVNGWLMRRHEGGYYPFREDITDVVRPGERNVITVRVDASRFEGWFYEGAGIYRHVWLDKTAPVAVAPDGVFVSSQFAGHQPAGAATLQVAAEVLNHRTTPVEAIVSCTVLAPDGTTVAHLAAPAGTLAPGSRTTRELTGSVSAPALWSPESPQCYTLVTSVTVDGELLDRTTTPFGIRTVGFDPDRGFLLNGRPYPIHGVCNHQDHAGVGAAQPDALHAFRIARLKAFGCNAIRTAHNPPTPELLEAADRLGMLIMDENRLLGSDSENLRKLEDFVRRDRNHPSVVVWSISNEEFAVQSTPQGGRVARTMQDVLKRLDPTRPVTYPAPQGDTVGGINDVIEVRGWNYHPGPAMDTYHAKHPRQPNVGTEQGSTTGTRGIYATDAAAGHVAAYDEPPHQWVTSAEAWWSWFAPRPWLSGGFVWTGFDYRGEPTPLAWPSINSHFGILDLCGFPKDNFYYYQAWWTDQTVLHLLPHWTWPGREGDVLRVDALSNCAAVELFLNGTSLGRRVMSPQSKLTWQVAYTPGTLSARGFDAAGRVIATTGVETTGAPTALRLVPDRTVIAADGEDLAIFTVSAHDAQGRLVPVANNRLHFDLAGAGKIIGVGNGDPACLEPDTFVPDIPVRTVALTSWRYQPVPLAPGPSPRPEYARDFDDATWTRLDDVDGSWPRTIDAADTTVVYRAHVTISAAEAENGGTQVTFRGCDDEGWYFVNGHFIGETHDWNAAPAWDITAFLQPGDNVLAVICRNGGGAGGLNPAVSVEIAAAPVNPAWSRSLFNGLAQVIVQATDQAGPLTLTATAEGLPSAAATVTTRPAIPRPFVP